MQKKQNEINNILANYNLVFDVDYLSDSQEVKNLWDVRRAILPCAGNSKKALEALILEDVAFPVELLAKGITDLELMLDDYGYNKDIAGHALTGNLHFNLFLDLDSKHSVDRYLNFMNDFTDMVVNKYNGSLKAEHGTGRNMAPFVAKEWGDKIYEIMKTIKRLIDPSNLMNPDVLINDDPGVIVKNLKQKVQLDSGY